MGMSYQPGPPTPGPPTPGPPTPGPPVPTDVQAQRHQLAAEISNRQAAIAAAQVEVGQIVAGEIRAGRMPVPSAEVDAELRRVISAEYAIAELGHQLRAVDAEADAAAWAAASVDPSQSCPACRSAVTPYQRYCPVCGQRLRRNIEAAQVVLAPNGYPVPAPPSCARCGRAVDAGAGYCAECGWRVGRSQVRWYRARWLRLGLAGFLLYVFCQAMLPHTHDAYALVMAELIIGAVLVPVTFVAYFYERGTHDQTPLSVLVTTFIAGAILGCTAAVILETAVKVSGNWGYIAVGFIEEGCKALIVLTWLRRRDLFAPDRGLVIGAATGMGFAALETMQYGIQAFIGTLANGGTLSQQLTAMSAVLNIRGVLAPLGHGTWTGILAAVIWYERSAGRSVLGGRVLISYAAVSLLHGIYDIAAGSHVALITLVSGARVSVLVILIGLFGFAALMGIARAGRNGRNPVTAFFDAVTGARSAPPPGQPPGWPR
jgi:protease PrsW